MTEVEYLDYQIAYEDAKPMSDKVQSILEIEYPKCYKDISKSIKLVNFYSDIWKDRPYLLFLLVVLTSKKEYQQ